MSFDRLHEHQNPQCFLQSFLNCNESHPLNLHHDRNEFFGFQFAIQSVIWNAARNALEARLLKFQCELFFD